MSSHVYIFSHCPLFENKRLILLSTVKNIDGKLLDYSDLSLTQILLFGDHHWMLILTRPFLTQPLTLLYSPRDLKNYLFKLPIVYSAQLLFFILFPLYWYFLEYCICFFFLYFIFYLFILLLLILWFNPST